METSMRYALPAITALALTATAAFFLVRAADAAPGDVVVTSAWARATPPGAKVAGAYVTVQNRGSEPDRLVSIASPVAADAMVHETVEENGIASMRPLPDIIIAPGASLDMTPGGIHVMLMELKAPLKAGEQIAVTLTFEKAGSVTAQAAVAPIGAEAPAMPMDHTTHKM
jgi:copper(I)-binding protein